LYASSSTVDADFFLTLRAFSPEGKEVTFKGANDPNVPLSQGWLRASHRKLDPKLSTTYRPYHSHDEIQPLIPGQAYELDVELWPTCIVLPKGFKITLTIAGKDFERLDSKEQFKGSGPFYHTYASDRPQSIFNGVTELLSAPGRVSYVLLPFVPPKS
jgi:predicted acyl esterase